MELRELFKTIKKHMWLILGLIILAIVISVLISVYILDDVYESSAVMIINSTDNNTSENLTYNQYNLNVKLVNSYRVLCTTDLILNQVIDRTNISLSVKELSDNINIISQDDTGIIKIVVKGTESKETADITNALAMVFKQEVPKIMKMDNVQIIDMALPSEPIKPNIILNLLIAIIVSLVIGLGIALLIEYLDITIKTKKQLEELYKLPVLGEVPHLKSNILLHY